jgi:integrase
MLSTPIAKDPMAVFLYAVKSPESKRQYPRRFKMFLDFLGFDGSLKEQAKEFLRNAKQDPEWVQNSLIQFVSYHNDRAKRGEISVSTIPNYYRATKLFCEMNDIVLGWKKIARGMARVRKAANDRAPTLEEIQRLIEYPDRRIKPIVYTTVSSGIRIGAWDYLQWKHVLPMINAEGEIVAARLLVYAGDPEEYYSFITPEAYNSLKDWMDFRSSYGENISGESWVMRDIWQTTNNFPAIGVITAPVIK